MDLSGSMGNCYELICKFIAVVIKLITILLIILYNIIIIINCSIILVCDNNVTSDINTFC